MATITNVGTGLVQKPLTTQEWASAVSMPPKQGPVQPAPARAVPAPAPAQATKPSSTLLQRAMAGEFGTKMQQTLASKNAPQEVDATSLGTSGITVPPPASTRGSSSAVNATIAQTTPVVATEDGATQASPRDQAIQNYMQMLGTGFETTEETKDLQTAAAEAKLTLDNLNTRMTEYEKETRDEEYAMRQNPEGKLAGALQADIQNYKYDRYAKKDGIADMAIAAQFALNNAEYAYEIANNAVTSEKERYTSQMQGFRDLYTMLQNDMTESEQMQYQSQLRMYENSVTSTMDAKTEAIRFAQENGAPQDVLLGIKNAKTQDEVWQVAGQYGLDPARGLEQQYIRAQISKLGERPQILAPTQVIDQNGRKLLVNTQTGEVISDFGVNDVSANDYEVAVDQERISAIDNLRSHSGLNSAVGATYFGRFALTDAFGAKDAFIGGVEQMVESLTVENLIKAKESGATFGALSDGERNMLAASATKIGQWRVRKDDDPNKKVIGYDVGEKDMLKELDKIAAFAKYDAYLKGQSPADIGIIQTPDGKVAVRNSDGTLTQFSPR